MENTIRSSIERASPIVELREYTLHPGGREKLIGVFDRHLVETQEDTGMTVIGQFRDPDRPDRFVWLRGFDNMEARKRALADFYGGPAWAARKEEANATMIAFDNVLLLRPGWLGAGFDLTGRARGACEEAVTEPDQRNRAVLLTVHHIRTEATGDFASIIRTEAAPLSARLGAPLVGILVSEHAENTFPRLPVRESENVLVTFQEFPDIDRLDAFRDALAVNRDWRAIEAAHLALRSREPEIFRLLPTPRSLLGRPAAR